MKASLLDLRRKTQKVVEAIDKNQKVTLTRRGKSIAVITPIKRPDRAMRVADHPAFGMASDSTTEVNETMRKLRASRYAL